MKFRFLISALMLSVNVYCADNDSVSVSAKTEPRHKLKPAFLNHLYNFVKEFSRVDTHYVEPQHYNYTVMLQNTNTYEIYHLSNKSGQEVVFAPRPTYKVGPYFGWRWVFLGYTFDITRPINTDGRQDFNLSLYSNQIGIDLFYRKSGRGYRVTELTLGNNIDTSPMKNVEFGGFSSSVKGFNLYYIFNHKKFSYPAAYSQSTVQRRSCGSPIVGIGYTKHKFDVDWKAFKTLVDSRLGEDFLIELADTTMTLSNVNYTDYSVSGGYAYNWVFAYNWLFDISLQAGLGYKRSNGDTQTSNSGFLRSFDFKNFNIDGILRMGVVWNNTKWYMGANTILHTYNYRKSQFSTNNVFGNVNFYVGFNFGKR